MFLAFVLTFCLLVLPLSSAFVVSGRTSSSFAVTSSSQKGIGGRIHRQPLHLLPETTALVAAAAAAAAEVVKDESGKNGFTKVMESGWTQVLSAAGFLILYLQMQGAKVASDNTANNEKLSSEMKSIKVELSSKIDKLSSKTDLRIGELSLSMEKHSINTDARLDKLTASIDKLSDKREA